MRVFEVLLGHQNRSAIEGHSPYMYSCVGEGEIEANWPKEVGRSQSGTYLFVDTYNRG